MIPYLHNAFFKVLKPRLEQLATGKLGSWSRTLEHFPPFSLELVENIQRLSVPPKASGNQGYELFHGAHPTISKVC